MRRAMLVTVLLVLGLGAVVDRVVRSSAHPTELSRRDRGGSFLVDGGVVGNRLARLDRVLRNLHLGRAVAHQPHGELLQLPGTLVLQLWVRQHCDREPAPLRGRVKEVGW